MTDTSKLDFAARQRIYDEEIAREKRFRSMFLRFQEGTPTKYFLNPFRGRKNNAVAGSVVSRGKRFLDKDEAFLRSMADGALFSSAARSRRSASAGGVASTSSAAGNNGNNSRTMTPLPELRSPTPQLQQQEATAEPSVTHAHARAAVSPASGAAAQRRPASVLDLDDGTTSTNLYDPTTSVGRSMLRMRLSNSVLRPRTQLVGDAIEFDRELKAAQRPPQERYGYPRTEAQSVGWFHEALNKVDRAPSANGSRIANGGYYKASGLKTAELN